MMATARVAEVDFGSTEKDQHYLGNASGEDFEVQGDIVAYFLGITDRRVRQLCDEGMPRAARGLYPLVRCVRWYNAYWKTHPAKRINDQKYLKLKLQNALLAHKVKTITEKVIDRQECVTVWSASFRRLGAMIDRLPSSLGRELHWTPETVKIVRARLDEARETFIRDSAEFADETDYVTPER